MLKFLANTLEQLDLALDHVSKSDANNARFGLMLTDNAVELYLHYIAVDKKSSIRGYSFVHDAFEHKSELNDALGHFFDPKIRFARLMGHISFEQANTISVAHQFRNEVHHIGVQHEEVLPSISRFYFHTACNILGAYHPPYIGWSSGDTLPERALKYFPADGPGLPFGGTVRGSPDQYREACKSLASRSGHSAAAFRLALVEHMNDVVERNDDGIGYIAEGFYVGDRKTRDEAIVDLQAWAIAFTAKGKDFMRNNGYDAPTVGSAVAWIADHYPFAFQRDPIPAWKRRVASVRGEKNSHMVLKKYRTFMDDTAVLREWIDESWSALDTAIEAESDRLRGK